MEGVVTGRVLGFQREEIDRKSERGEATNLVSMRGNYKTIPSVVFLFVFLCLLIIFVIFLTALSMFIHSRKFILYATLVVVSMQSPFSSANNFFKPFLDVILETATYS